jgi:hypothetical protein
MQRPRDDSRPLFVWGAGLILLGIKNKHSRRDAMDRRAFLQSATLAAAAASAATPAAAAPDAHATDTHKAAAPAGAGSRDWGFRHPKGEPVMKRFN